MDVIVTRGTPAALAALRAIRTIPIVMASSGDPVATGIVGSLAHPGGNITGLSDSGDPRTDRGGLGEATSPGYVSGEGVCRRRGTNEALGSVPPNSLTSSCGPSLRRRRYVPSSI